MSVLFWNNRVTVPVPEMGGPTARQTADSEQGLPSLQAAAGADSQPGCNKRVLTRNLKTVCYGGVPGLFQHIRARPVDLTPGTGPATSCSGADALRFCELLSLPYWQPLHLLPSLIDLAASDGMLSGELPQTRGQTVETAAACTNSMLGCGTMDCQGGMSARSRS
jgi:hypothetical protein